MRSKMKRLGCASIRTFVLLATVGSFLICGTAQSGKPPVRLYGYVTDQTTAQPVPAAYLDIRDQAQQPLTNTTSNASGYY
jgi:hypothetical protein